MAYPARIQGYTNMGKVRVPVLPQFMVLEDRADGTEWYLSHDGGHTHFAINSAAIPYSDVVRYAAYEGPVMGTNPTIRLLVRGGRLGYEVTPLQQGVTDLNNQRVLSSRLTGSYRDRWTDEIMVPALWQDGLGLAWEGIDLG